MESKASLRIKTIRRDHKLCLTVKNCNVSMNFYII